jgi:hypothetical protein
VRWFGKKATKGQKIGIPPPILKWIEDEIFGFCEVAELFGLFGSGSHGLIDED